MSRLAPIIVCLVLLYMQEISNGMGYERLIYNFTLSEFNTSFLDTNTPPILVKINNKDFVVFPDEGRIIFWDVNQKRLNKTVFVENARIKLITYNKGSQNLYFTVKNTLKSLELTSLEIDGEISLKDEEVIGIVEFKPKVPLVATKDGYLMTCNFVYSNCTKLLNRFDGIYVFLKVMKLNNHGELIINYNQYEQNQGLFQLNVNFNSKEVNRQEIFSLSNCSIKTFSLVKASELLISCIDTRKKPSLNLYSIHNKTRIKEFHTPNNIMVSEIVQIPHNDTHVVIITSAHSVYTSNILDLHTGEQKFLYSWNVTEIGFSLGGNKFIFGNKIFDSHLNKEDEVWPLRRENKAFEEYISLSQKTEKLIYLSTDFKLNLLNLNSSDKNRLHNFPPSEDVKSLDLVESGDSSFIFYLLKSGTIKKTNLKDGQTYDIYADKNVAKIFAISPRDLLVSTNSPPKEHSYDLHLSNQKNHRVWSYWFEEKYYGQILRAKLLDNGIIVILFKRKIELFDKKGVFLKSINIDTEFDNGVFTVKDNLLVGNGKQVVAFSFDEQGYSVQSNETACYNSKIKDLTYFISDANEFVGTLCENGAVRVLNISHSYEHVSEFSVLKQNHKDRLHRIFFLSGKLIVAEKNSFSFSTWKLNKGWDRCFVNGCLRCSPSDNNLCQECRHNLYPVEATINSNLFKACSSCMHEEMVIERNDGKEVCRKCNVHIKSCRQCFNNNNYLNCTKCEEGNFRLINEKGVSCTDCQAARGYYKANKITDGTGTCKNCSDEINNCEICSETQRTCTKCFNGFYHKASADSIRKACVKCDADSEFISGGDCLDCSVKLPHCRNCKNRAENCHYCEDGYFLLAEGKKVICSPCQEGNLVKNISDRSCKHCNEVHKNCNSCCLYTGKCLSCEEGYYLDLNKCQECSSKFGETCSKCTFLSCEKDESKGKDDNNFIPIMIALSSLVATWLIYTILKIIKKRKRPSGGEMVYSPSDHNQKWVPKEEEEEQKNNNNNEKQKEWSYTQTDNKEEIYDEKKGDKKKNKEKGNKNKRDSGIYSQD